MSGPVGWTIRRASLWVRTYMYIYGKYIINILLSLMNVQYDHHDISDWTTKTFMSSSKVMEAKFLYLFVYSLLLC